jgi:predicted acetylornithine/succinylornithine family transaminase
VKDIQPSPDLFNVFRRQPVLFVRGRGPYLWDSSGKKYLDFFAGLAVCGLGHADPGVARAVADQSRRLVHVSNLYYTQPQRDLARELVRRSFPSRIFFANSGAEANECAIKLARRFGHRTPYKGAPRDNVPRYEIIVFENSFHGRTLGTLAATAQEKYKTGFGPLPEGFPVAKFGDMASVRAVSGPKTCAVLIEPIQGEGGVNMASPSFFRSLKNFCRQRNLLLIFDEVQTGIGRTGKLFAYEHLSVKPDIFTLAKGLANGLPIGACVARPAVADLFGPGDHASTFSGGPVVCQASRVVLKALTPQMLRRIRILGERFRREIESWKKEIPSIRSVRGVGFMWGIELDRPGADLVMACLKDGLLINCTADRVIRLLPPFCLSDQDVVRGLSILRKNLFTAHWTKQ